MWLVKVELTFVWESTEPEAPDGLDTFLSNTYAQLCALDGACNPNLVAVLKEHRASFSLVVTDSDRYEAIRNAASLIRTALHAAGGHTPDWGEVEAALARSRMSSEPVLEDDKAQDSLVAPSLV